MGLTNSTVTETERALHAPKVYHTNVARFVSDVSISASQQKGRRSQGAKDKSGMSREHQQYMKREKNFLCKTGDVCHFPISEKGT